MNATYSGQAPTNSQYVSKKDEKYMNTLDSQIKRTETEIETIRKNMQKLQDENLQIRDEVNRDKRSLGTQFSDDELKSYYKA